MTPKIGHFRNDRLELRISAELKKRVQAVANAQGETVTALIERALNRELERIAREKEQGRDGQGPSGGP